MASVVSQNTENTVSDNHYVNSIESGRCLICNSNSKLETMGSIGAKTFYQPISTILSSQLNVFFVLRHVLELPSKLLEKYLRFFPNPENWIKVCQICNEAYLEKCYRIFMELLEVKRRFVEAKLEVVEAMQRSDRNEDDGLKVRSPSSRKNHHWILDISNEVRSFVGKHEYSSSRDINPFLIGDEMARSKMEVGDPCNLKTCDLPFSQNSCPPQDIKNDYPEMTIPINHDGSSEIKSEPSSPGSAGIDEEDVRDESNYLESDPDYVDEYEEPVSVERDYGSDDGKCGSTSPEKSGEGQDSPESEARDHQRQVVKNKFQCSNCEWSTNDRKKYAWHKKVHSQKTIKCPKCPKRFRLQSFLKRHMNNIHKDRGQRKKFQCDLCGREFLWKTSFQNHMAIKHEEKQLQRFTCYFDNCGKSFHSKRRLLRHEDHHKEPSKECNVCGLKFKTMETLRRHMVQHEYGEERHFKCDQCPSTFARKDNLGAHIRKVHESKGIRRAPRNESQEKCSKCDKRFSISATLQRHMLKDHPETAENFEKIGKDFCCDQCGKTFRTQGGLQRHESSHAQHVCQLCGITLRTKNILKRHILVTHEGQLPYSCKLCPDKFNSHQKLMTHMTKSHGVAKKQFVCSICGIASSSKSNLDIHVRTVHERTEEVCCDLCGNILKSRSYLREHQARVHNIGREQFREFLCSVEGCGKKFGKESQLKLHIRTAHEGERPFECKECGKRLTSSKNLRRHVRAMHMNRESKPYKCEECGKGFAISDYLWLHKKTHKPKE